MKLSLSHALSSPIGFHPRDVEGCVLWLRADMGVTLTSGKVSTWADQSGKGNDATQGTAGSRPTQVAGVVNGQSVIRFSGSNVLQTPAIALDKMTVFVVHGTITTRGVLVEQSVSSGSNSGFYVYSAGSSAINERRSTSFHAGDLNNWDPLTAAIVVASYDGVTPKGWINGVAKALSLSGAAVSGAVTDNLYLGARSGPTVGTNGDIAEIVIFNRSLNATELTRVHQYLSMRYAIAVT